MDWFRRRFAEAKAVPFLDLMASTLGAQMMPLRPFGVYGTLDATARDVLVRAPMATFQAASVGGSFDGERLAVVSLPRGSIEVYSPRTGNVEKIAADFITDPYRPPLSLAIGFLPDRGRPVVYDNGTLRYWRRDGSLASVSASTVAADVFKGADAPYADIAAGNVRLSLDLSPSTRLVSVLVFDELSQSFKAMGGSSRVLSMSGGFWPTLSEANNKFAALDGDGKLHVGMRSHVGPPVMRYDVPLAVTSSPQIVRSMAFVAGGADLVIRDDLTSFLLIEGMGPADTPAKITRFTIPLQKYPYSVLTVLHPQESRTTADRPPLAVARTARGLRLAWIADDGVAVFETGENNTLVHLSSRSPLLLSMGATNAPPRLQFSSDGDLLTLQQQNGSGVAVRVWDLSEARLKHVMTMSSKSLLSEICTTLARDPTNYLRPHRLEEADFANLPYLQGIQPCPEKPQ
jgi:hypothetical protein